MTEQDYKQPLLTAAPGSKTILPAEITMISAPASDELKLTDGVHRLMLPGANEP